MIKPDKDLQNIREEIYSHMLKTRGSKYKYFLYALRSFKYLSMNSTRGDFLEYYYSLMRYVDDVVDGDLELPSGYKTKEDFVAERIDFSLDARKPKHQIDYLMLYCFELASKFGEDFSEETRDILSSMLFDAKRYGKKELFPEEVLFHHFHLLDVKGTIRATLKVFGENPENYSRLENLGLASRIYYNLRDYDEDLEAGFVNIPKEDCLRLRIRPNDLENRVSSGVNNWFKEQSEKGIELLDEHNGNMSNGSLGFLAKVTLPLVYEKPARRYFERVIK